MSPTTTVDPCPQLLVERGTEGKGVGSWVPEQKHRLLEHYLLASQHAWRRWGQRAFIDPFGGPGRIQVKGENFTRDGGAVVAWRALHGAAVPFTQMLVGDLEGERASACAERLRSLGASATPYAGPAVDTIKQMVAAVPSRGALSLAYIDPYNLEYLSFSILQALAGLKKVDLAINFCTMDLQRNAEFEFDPTLKKVQGERTWCTSEGGIFTISFCETQVIFAFVAIGMPSRARRVVARVGAWLRAVR